MFFWWIGSFIYFKVAFDLAFDKDMAIIAAMLLAVMVCISAYYSAYFYAVKSGQHTAHIMFGKATNFLQSSWWVWVITALINIAVGKAIVFGFSKKLNNEISYDSLLFDFGRYRADEGWIFILLIIIPITFHYATVLAAIYFTDKNAKQRLSAEEKGTKESQHWME